MFIVCYQLWPAVAPASILAPMKTGSANPCSIGLTLQNWQKISKVGNNE
jgi:hypothetical protein